MEGRILYRIHVTGMVQGVGYRWSAAREAWKRGLAGYVKNMSDGSVYIEAEGNREELEGFAEWCLKGPGRGFVDAAEVTETTAAGHREFRIEN
jgi:acylphosphatase